MTGVADAALAAARGGGVRTVLVDDNTLFRQGLRELLTSSGEIDVVAEGKDGDEAVQLAVEHRPTVLLLDVEMPGRTAASTLAELQRVAPDTRVVVLTMHHDAPLVTELLDIGAAAYLVKTVAVPELVAAIVGTAGTANDTVTLSIPRSTLRGMDARAPESPLSAREHEILELIALAKSNAQIASELFITEATVKRHLTNMYAKLGAVSRLDAVRRATEAGLLAGPS